MNGLANAVIVLLLAAIVIFAIAGTVRRSRKGGGCCGEHEQMPEKVRVADRNKAHYPFHMTAKVDGMTCDRCARRTENALNSLDGVLAFVELGHHTAEIYTKTPPDENVMRQAVRDAGYVIHDFAAA